VIGDSAIPASNVVRTKSLRDRTAAIGVFLCEPSGARALIA
jgi:hypothetical protein